MRTRARRRGDSLRIPRVAAEASGIRANSEIEIAGGNLVLTPVRESPLTLAELLEQVAEENLQRKIAPGSPRNSLA
ncbi:MAG: hypothetical protein HY534_03225 [Chloroflexi bacterium]|nr:hypothetical protein [Chloroflexota bacterium]